MDNKIVLLTDPNDYDPANPRTKVISGEEYYKDTSNNRLNLAKEFVSSNTESNVEALLISFSQYHHGKRVVQNERETDWYRASPEAIIGDLIALSRRKSTVDLSEHLSKIPILAQLRSETGARRRSLSVTEYTDIFKTQDSMASDAEDVAGQSCSDAEDVNGEDEPPISLYDAEGVESSDTDGVAGQSCSDSLEDYMNKNNGDNEVEQESYNYYESFKNFQNHDGQHSLLTGHITAQTTDLPRSSSQHDSLSHFTFVADNGMTFTGSGSQEDLSMLCSSQTKPAVTKIPRPKPKIPYTGIKGTSRTRSDSRLGTFLPISNAQESTILLQDLDHNMQARQRYYLCKTRTQGGVIIIILTAILLSLWYIIWVSSGTWHPF